MGNSSKVMEAVTAVGGTMYQAFCSCLYHSLHYKVMGKRGDQKSNRILCSCDRVVIVPFPEGNETHSSQQSRGALTVEDSPRQVCPITYPQS